MGVLYLALLLVSCSLGVCVGIVATPPGPTLPPGEETVGVEYGVKSYPLLQGQCPSLQERERVREEITAEVKAILSGAVYSCNGSPGWRRVGFVDMTDPSQDCPPGLTITRHLIRTCGSSHTGGRDCSSTTFSVGGVEYSQVCGRIKAYQYGEIFAFNSLRNSIEQAYVDGVSLTHGGAGERQHIWTFAAGYAEEDIFRDLPSIIFCPCDTEDPSVTSPPYVGVDYFCESGNDNTNPTQVFFVNDPLWDGEGCGSTSTCCQLNNPPEFTKTLPTPTTDDIELRLCHSGQTIHGDVPIELIELYVK